MRALKNSKLSKIYAPGRTRTCGTQIRNLVLYPPELRGHVKLIYLNNFIIVKNLMGENFLENYYFLDIKSLRYGDVAQQGERDVRNVQVGGSNPLISISILKGAIFYEKTVRI